MIRFDRATTDDDAELRAVLRENGMRGWVTMTMEREPSFFAGADRFGQDEAIIARQGDATVGMYVCSTHCVFVDGKPASVGYLGGLRVRPAFRHRLRILRGGYASVRSIGAASGRAYWYTSVASENLAARRLLEANLPGMPEYRPCGDMVTMALPCSRGRRLGLWREVDGNGLAGFCECFNHYSMQYQFSPCLDVGAAARTGARFFVAVRDGLPFATMALWNQQAYKQVVARAYQWPLSAAVPLYNAYARATRRVCLPDVGQALDQTCLSFFSVASGASGHLVDLLRDALSLCATRVMTLGLSAEHAWVREIVKAFRPAIYRTGIYVVHFGEPPTLDARPPQPEVAVL